MPLTPYTHLEPTRIITTISKLEKRIQDRFPESSILQTCHGFIEIANETKENIDYIKKPNLAIRAFVLLIIGLGLIGAYYSFRLMDFNFTRLNLIDIVTFAEASINDLILLGAAIFFLVSIESRLKKTKAAKILDQLRGLAHVIDMHQLTKDPTMVGVIQLKTYNSPKRTLNKFELKRYLDYCSEMLSLVGKVAALYSQNLPESGIISAVNEIENLSTGLSNKIWQKMIILNDIDDKPSLQLDDLNPQ